MGERDGDCGDDGDDDNYADADVDDDDADDYRGSIYTGSTVRRKGEKENPRT